MRDEKIYQTRPLLFLYDSWISRHFKNVWKLRNYVFCRTHFQGEARASERVANHHVICHSLCLTCFLPASSQQPTATLLDVLDINNTIYFSSTAKLLLYTDLRRWPIFLLHWGVNDKRQSGEKSKLLKESIEQLYYSITVQCIPLGSCSASSKDRETKRKRRREGKVSRES